MVPKNKLAVSPVTRPEDSCFKLSEKSSSVVERSKKSKKWVILFIHRNTIPLFSQMHQIKFGGSFRKHDSQWQLDRSRKLLHINVLELKAVFLALKELSKQILDKRVLIASHNATVVSYLSKQEGTHSWDRCLLVWRILAYCNPRIMLIRARHIQGCLNVIVDSLSRKDKIIQTEWSLHSQIFSLIWLSLVHTNGGHVCHQIGSQTTNLCLTSPRCKCYEHRCIEHLLGGSGRLWLLSCSTHTKSDTGNEHLQVQVDSSCTRVAQNALVLGSSQSVNQAPLQLPHCPHLLKQPFSQKFHQNLMFLNLHVWHLDTTQNHLNHSLSRWQIELRHLIDPHLEDYMSQGGPILNSGANRIRWSAQSPLSQT